MADDTGYVFGTVERMVVLGNILMNMRELESHVAWFETEADDAPAQQAFSWLWALTLVSNGFRIPTILFWQRILKRFPDAPGLAAEELSDAIISEGTRQWPGVAMHGSLVQALIGLPLRLQAASTTSSIDQRIQARIGVLATYALIYSDRIGRLESVVHTIVSEHSHIAFADIEVAKVRTQVPEVTDTLESSAEPVRNTFVANMWSAQIESGNPWFRRSAISIQ